MEGHEVAEGGVFLFEMSSKQAFKDERELQEALRRNKDLAGRNPDLVIRAAEKREVKSAAVIQSGRVLRLEVLLPIKLVSESNQHEHWSKKHERNVEQQAELWKYWRELVGSIKLAPPLVIKLTRIGVNKLDDGNCAIAAKNVQDAIARILGMDDGDKLLKWEYDQIYGEKEYGMKVEFICQ